MGVKKSGQLLGSPVSEIVDSENNPDFKERLMRLSDGSSNKPASFKMKRQDQKEVFLELSSVPVLINRENASLVMGRDITKQTVAEEKLRENEKLLSSILQAAPIGIGLVKERVFFWVNDAFVKMLGYSRRELIGQSSRLIYPDHEHYERAGRIKYRQLQLEPIGKVETKFRRKNGEVIDVLLSSVALNTNDISAGTTFTAVDISQRNLSEMILKENEERYRTLFENMAQGVFYQASDGTLLNVNKAALKMLGVTKTQFLGKDGIPPKWKVVNENMEEIPDEKHPVRISLVSGKKVKDKVIGVFNPRLKKFVWLLVNTQPQFRSGSAKPYQVFVTLHDLTEIKNAEIELKKSYEEIKKLSRHTEEIREEERKQIARNLHDELGQILTATKMDVSWIKNKLKGKEELLVQRADATLEIIDQAIRGIQQITSELRPPILDNLGLYEALKSLVADFHKRTGLLTYIELPEKETPLNPDFNISLYRIIQEALTNVIRHAQAGQIRLKIIEKNNTLEIQISDNGKGIQEEKVLSSDSLGLIGIKERVIRWKGEFSITGKPEEGTKLRISFPLSSINKN
jgi:PAS domain S-box-containing protein